MKNWTSLLHPALLFFIFSICISIQKVKAANLCEDSTYANVADQLNTLGDLGNNLFPDPKNCAFPQVPVGAKTENAGVTADAISKMLEGNPMFSKDKNPGGDRKKIVADLFNKTQSDVVKNKIDSMRAQLACQKVQIEYSSDGPAQNIMNFKRSFTSNLSPEDLAKYHKIDVSEYTKKGNSYLVKDMDQFGKKVEKFIQDKNASDRPVFVCTDEQRMNYNINMPNAVGIDFSDSFVTGLPVLSNEDDVKAKVCNSIKNLKPECIKSVSVSTSSDRRSNCDRSKNIINKNGENECPYVSGTTIGRNDFEQLSKDRANKLEQIIMSCSVDSLKGKISKDASGARGDGSSGVCPYEPIDKAKFTTKIKPEFAKDGASVKDLDQNRYAKINIESTRALGCDGNGKEVTDTTTVSVKCIRIQAKCIP